MTRALILAAGRGERMRPLTDRTPKPLLEVRGKPLIVWHLEALARAGVRDVVINTAWLEEQFPAVLGDGARWGVTIHYSMEGRDHGGPLDVAGGIAKALPQLAPDGGDAPFWVISGDIYAPAFDPAAAPPLAAEDDALIWLVPNPAFHADGDFALDAAGRVSRPAQRPLTFASYALMRPRLVRGVVPGQPASLGPALFASVAAGRVAGRMFEGPWENVGTPRQLAALNEKA